MGGEESKESERRDTWISGAAEAGGGRRLEPGASVGSYRLLRLLGEGSMGQVYLAEHRRLGRRVAIKLLRPEHACSREHVRRFFQEARAVNAINHEHIVEVFDFAEETGPEGEVRAYCVMELLDGESLAGLLQRGPVPLARALRLGEQLAAALGAAHRLGVVHRDVKPDNVFVCNRGGRDHVKVLDFGVAKLVRPVGELPVGTTANGAIIGTPSYMSPEQAAGRAVDARCDVHAVGAVLYELVTGQVPFPAAQFGELVARLLTEKAPALPARSRLGERVPSGLRELVAACLEKDPAKRPELAVVQARLAALGAPGGERPRAVLLGAPALAAALALAWAFARLGAPAAPAAEAAPAEAAAPAYAPAMERTVHGRAAAPTAHRSRVTRDGVIDPYAE